MVFKTGGEYSDPVPGHSDAGVSFDGWKKTFVASTTQLIEVRRYGPYCIAVICWMVFASSREHYNVHLVVEFECWAAMLSSAGLHRHRAGPFMTVAVFRSPVCQSDMCMHSCPFGRPRALFIVHLACDLCPGMHQCRGWICIVLVPSPSEVWWSWTSESVRRWPCRWWGCKCGEPASPSDVSSMGLPKPKLPPRYACSLGSVSSGVNSAAHIAGFGFVVTAMVTTMGAGLWFRYPWHRS